MTRKDMLRNRLEAAYRGSRFHSFLGSLKGVSEADARWTPEGYRGFPHMTGSILNLAYHTGGDKHVLASTAFGDGTVTWRLVGQRFEALGADLSSVRTLAAEGHAHLLSVLASLAEADLDSPRHYGGRTHSAAEIISIAAEHDIYHAGQIWYVRNLLAGRP